MNSQNYILKSFKKIVFLVSLFLLFKSSVVLAQSGSTSLTVIPPKFELFGNPGDTISEKIRVRNESDTPQTYTILLEDFTTSGEDGEVMLEEGEDSTSFALAKWIEPSSTDLILQPNEESSINFLINIPRNAEPGGHYSSLLFQSGGDVAVEGGASVAQRVGSLILLRVSGNVLESAKIESFDAPKYLEKSPVAFITRVKNESNTHIIPNGTIVITNLFGKKVAEVPLAGRNVLPEAIRRMDTLWDQERIIGVYTATLIATYGQSKQPLTATTNFTVVPKIVLIIGIVGAVAIVGFILTLFFGRKRLAKVLRTLIKG